MKKIIISSITLALLAAYELELNATDGSIFAAEQESLAEIEKELSGDLSHEGFVGDID